jgi:hypothetical protein
VVDSEVSIFFRCYRRRKQHDFPRVKEGADVGVFLNHCSRIMHY